jgi:hypothetical protein
MPIQPVRYLRPLKGGWSYPQLILFNDGHKYVVKFKNNRQGDKVLVNEYVAGKLARYLRLPVPKFTIVHIPKRFIQTTSLKTFGFQPGVQFASRYIENGVCYSKNLSSQVINHHHLIGMVAFDHWVNNTDRNIRNLLLEPVQPISPHPYKVWMIDHGYCFPGCSKWSIKSLRQPPHWINSPLYQALFQEDHESKNQVLSKYVNKINQLPAGVISNIIRSLPDDWRINREEKQALFTFLIRSKKALPSLLSSASDETAASAGAKN